MNAWFDGLKFANSGKSCQMGDFSSGSSRNEVLKVASSFNFLTHDEVTVSHISESKTSSTLSARYGAPTEVSKGLVLLLWILSLQIILPFLLPCFIALSYKFFYLDKKYRFDLFGRWRWRNCYLWIFGRKNCIWKGGHFSTGRKHRYMLQQIDANDKCIFCSKPILIILVHKNNGSLLHWSQDCVKMWKMKELDFPT